jgi:hypothetical protein
VITYGDDELITGVGERTPVGAMLSRSEETATLADPFPEPDGVPKPIRLLAEDLVAYRDTSGRVGVVDPPASRLRPPTATSAPARRSRPRAATGARSPGYDRAEAPAGVSY